jgi:hypothetical protein
MPTKLNKSIKTQNAKTQFERYTALYRSNPTAKNRRLLSYWKTRYNNLRK